MPVPRIGIPIIGGTQWMAGVTYVEMLARSVRSLEGPQELFLVATPATIPQIESHLRLLPLFRGVILVLDPGMDPAPFRADGLIICRNRQELFERVDFVFPVLNDAWDECSASWIPDFQHRFLPDFFSQRERADRDAAFAKVADRARMLVLSSAVVEADFRKLYPSSRAVTKVLSFFAFADEAVFRGNPAAVRGKYGIPERYLLCCNQFWMHKDHRTLFRAVAELRKSGLIIPVVCTGSTTDYRSAGYFDTLKAEMTALGIGDQVVILGMIPREDQLQLIRSSCALVQPSLFEGWSSIVEDARSLGKPIFLTDLAVHREQDPPGGIFFHTGDPDSLAAALEAGFPSLPAGPDARKEEDARKASAERMRAFGRTFLDLAEEAKSLFEPDTLPGILPRTETESKTGGRVRKGGVNLIGYPSSNLGLGTAARNTLALLQKRQVPVTVFDLDAGSGRSLHETYFREVCVPTADLLPHRINLWHLNPPEVVHLMHHSEPKFEWDRFNACVPFWELSVLPDAWLQPLEAMDLVLAPTRFIEASLASTLRTPRVRYYRQPLSMPEPARLGREAWGLPRDATIFITSFDCGSDMLRKNPDGTVTAFLEKFRGSQDTLLVIKWVNENLDDTSRRSAATLRRAIEGQANIRVLDRTLPYPEVLALYRAADVYISLHRSEGLGLGLMECMALGMPVIGTGWSGNMDFMRESNSCLVGHRLVPVPSESVYGRMLVGKPARWAEPDIGEASEWMVRLARDPELRRTLGAKAEADIRDYTREAHEGGILDDLEALLGEDEQERAGKSKKSFDIPMAAAPPVERTRQEEGRSVYRGHAPESTEREGASNPSIGFNLIGFPSSNVGLGAAARNTLELLIGQGRPVAVYDIDAGDGRSGHEQKYRDRTVDFGAKLPHGINLWHINPPEVADQVTRTSQRFDWNRYNICIPFWELGVLPDSWISVLESMDLVLAPTRFIEATLAACLPASKVRYFRQPLHLPSIPSLSRENFGIPEGALVFVTNFDFGSDILRKNPLGTVVAFHRAFGGNPRMRLVLKWVNENLDASTRVTANRLREELGKHANIQIVDRNLPYPEVLALYRTADVYVSLHRAEGLGLGLMENMALGKPVIGTAWSGNLDFMTRENSCLVGYKMVDVPEGGAYDHRLGGKRAQWAEPDLDEAASHMVRLAGNAELRHAMGRRAAGDILEYNRVAVRGDIFAEVVSLYLKDRASAPSRPAKIFGAPTRPVGDWTPTGKPVESAGNAPPSDTSVPRGPASPDPDPSAADPKRIRPSACPGGEHPLHLRRLGDLGLLAPRPGAAKGNSKVTAVVSTYNSELFIRGCLQNLVEQTLFAQGRLEIVVVDSGSPQGEGAVVAEYRMRHPEIVYLRTERETLYAAWNRAIMASTGIYLVNANTDDRHRPDAFERMAAALDASYAGLVYGDALLTSGENETWASNTATHTWFLPDWNVRQGLTDCPFGCVVMWRKSLHDELGYFDPSFKIAGDYEFFLKAAILRNAIHLKEPLALYYESQKNLSYGNQPLVDKEVDTFLSPARLQTPLETIYPFLRVEHSPVARLAATMDFSAVLMHPLGRRGRLEALTRLLAVFKEVGRVPELMNNMAAILMSLGRKEEAKGLILPVLAENPALAASMGLGTPEGHWVPTRMLRIHHEGLVDLAEPIFSAHTRIPLPERATSNFVLRTGATG